MIRFLPKLAFLFVALSPVWAEEWVPLAIDAAGLASVETLLLREEIPAITPDNASVELSDFNGVVTEEVGQLSRRLTPADPRWDPWLRFWEAQFQKSERATLWVPKSRASEVESHLPGVVRLSATGDAQSPLRLMAWTVLVLGILGLALWGTSFLAGNRRLWRGLVLASVLSLVGFGVLLIPTSTGLPEGLAELYRHHLWYQWALPYGAHWDDDTRDLPVTLESFLRQGGQLVPVPQVIFTADRTWFTEQTSSLNEANVALLIGKIFP